jgi:nucleotide-binding universal stress UspA family protein
MKHKIFVPFDDSSCAQRALQHAADLARRYGDCSLHVAHAYDQPWIYGEIAVYSQRETLEKQQRERSEAVLASADAILKDSGVPYAKETIVGPVASTLIERVQALGCDSIVMGTRGLSAIGDILMGSTATKIVHLSETPVTLVK